MKLEEPEHKDSWEIRLFHNFNLPLFFPQAKKHCCSVRDRIDSFYGSVSSSVVILSGSEKGRGIVTNVNVKKRNQDFLALDAFGDRGVNRLMIDELIARMSEVCLISDGFFP